MKLKRKILTTDVLIIGGGTAGCFCAMTIAENSNLDVMIVEKAYIKRSGCLAAGVNALNAYITPRETPESFVEYVKSDSEGIIREDLVYSIAKRLNKVTKKIEELGLPILKDENGNYVERGKRSIKINGENIKSILAEAVLEQENITVINNVNMIDYIKKESQVIGGLGFSLEENVVCEIYAKAVICAAGGASGLYKPNNPEFSKHKMWYSPFNTGAGYAMGIRAGAEMTTFEMRFIALRCKDTIAPTGTIAQGTEAEQINSKGKPYVNRYGKPTTAIRLYATLKENEIGNGPCFLKTKGMKKEQEKELYKAYLNMAPSQTLKWIEGNTGPSSENVEIGGTEPYIVGGHAGSGYWVDTNRKTTLEGLYAIGDAAGGSPKKYVTGCFAEGEIAAFSAIEYIRDKQVQMLEEWELEGKIKEINSFFTNPDELYSIRELENTMQKVMDEYAGGISVGYGYNEAKLEAADKRIDQLLKICGRLKAEDMHELLFIYEILDRLYICKVLIQHLLARKETRWRVYQENLDYPHKDDSKFFKYVNSRYENGKVKILFRDLVGRDEFYEHSNQ